MGTVTCVAAKWGERQQQWPDHVVIDCCCGCLIDDNFSTTLMTAVSKHCLNLLSRRPGPKGINPDDAFPLHPTTGFNPKGMFGHAKKLACNQVKVAATQRVCLAFIKCCLHLIGLNPECMFSLYLASTQRVCSAFIKCCFLPYGTCSSLIKIAQASYCASSQRVCSASTWPQPRGYVQPHLFVDREAMPWWKGTIIFQNNNRPDGAQSLQGPFHCPCN